MSQSEETATPDATSTKAAAPNPRASNGKPTTKRKRASGAEADAKTLEKIAGKMVVLSGAAWANGDEERAKQLRAAAKEVIAAASVLVNRPSR